MKVILAILTISCTAFTMPEDCYKREIQAIKDSCPGRCIMQDKYREYVTQMLPIAPEFAQQIAKGGDATPIFPPLQPEKFDQICTEITTVQTCVGNCNDAADAEKKTKAQAILAAAKDIVCDADIKAQAPCLLEVGKVPSPTCNTQCAQYKDPILEAYNNYKQTGTRDWDKAKVAAKNVCLLVNCRLKCRKNDIVQKCQEAGYTTAKNLVKKLAVLGQTTHAQFRPSQNYPTECKPDAFIQGYGRVPYALDATISSATLLKLNEALRGYSKLVPLTSESNFIFFREGARCLVRLERIQTIFINSWCSPGRLSKLSIGNLLLPTRISYATAVDLLGTNSSHIERTRWVVEKLRFAYPNTTLRAPPEDDDYFYIFFRKDPNETLVCNVTVQPEESLITAVIINSQCDIQNLVLRAKNPHGTTPPHRPDNLTAPSPSSCSLSFLESNQDGNPRQVDFQTNRGTLAFFIRPSSSHIKSYKISLHPAFNLTITDHDAELSGPNVSLFEKKIYSRFNFLRFSATSRLFWVSFCDANQDPFIKMGVGYRMESNTRVVFKGMESTRVVLRTIQSVVFDERMPVISAEFSPDPVAYDKAYRVVPVQTSPEAIHKNDAIVPSQAGPKVNILFGNVAYLWFNQSDYDAINYSLDEAGCVLHTKIREKASNNSLGDGRTTYIRATLFRPVGTAPGHNFVVEIWPKGHYSPVHDHGSSTAIIRVLHGTLRSEWYNPLPDVSCDEPEKIKAEDLRAGDITWMDAGYHQTHKLINERSDTAAITIQAYLYGDDPIYNEGTFRYIRKGDPHIRHFDPNSDFDYLTVIGKIRQEYNAKRCMG